MDFLSNHKERVEGLLNQPEGLVIYDLHTKRLHIFPLTGRTAIQVSMCIQKFLGTAKCRVCYSDRAPELVAGIGTWGIPHEQSLPGNDMIGQISNIEESWKHTIKSEEWRREREKTHSISRCL